MKRKTLTETQTENLIELVNELRQKVKRKHEHLTLARHRLGNAKRSIKRMQEIIAYQRERILELHQGDRINSES
ncbi:MAG: hypothetical protein C0490_17595 [Marivirga sp.]|nr:hypothetical protein [Marivirga sp.]